jgi:IS30 family transposase
MKRLPAALRKSMTYDRGSEMACHPELAPPEDRRLVL